MRFIWKGVAITKDAPRQACFWESFLWRNKLWVKMFQERYLKGRLLFNVYVSVDDQSFGNLYLKRCINHKMVLFSKSEEL